MVAGYTEESKVVTGHNESANLTQESPAIDEEEEHHDADKHMWNHINAKIKPTMLKPGQIKEVIIVGAGASGLMCAMALKKKGVAVTIVEGRPRHGGRLYTDPDGLDIGGHWIHGGGPDDEVAAYSAAEIDKFELNPVRGLCDELGIATKLTDGDSCCNLLGRRIGPRQSRQHVVCCVCPPEVLGLRPDISPTPPRPHPSTTSSPHRCHSRWMQTLVSRRRACARSPSTCPMARRWLTTGRRRRSCGTCTTSSSTKSTHSKTRCARAGRARAA